MSKQPMVNHQIDSSPSGPLPSTGSGDSAGIQPLAGNDTEANSARQDTPMPQGQSNEESQEAVNRTENDLAVDAPSKTIQMKDSAEPVVSGIGDLDANESNWLQAIFQDITKRCGSSISALLQTRVSFQLGKIHASGSADRCSAVDGSPLTFKIETSWLPKPGYLTIDSSLATAMVDRMLGGNGEIDPSVDRILTAMESRLLLRLVTELAAEIQKSLDPELVSVPSVSRYQGLDGSETDFFANASSLSVVIDVSIANHKGSIQIDLPSDSIRNLSPSSYGDSDGHGKELSRQSHESLANIGQTKLAISVNVATSKVKASDLLALNVGDIITTEKDANEHLELWVQGVPKFHVHAGSYQGKKAVQILGVLDESKPSGKTT